MVEIKRRIEGLRGMKLRLDKKEAEGGVEEVDQFSLGTKLRGNSYFIPRSGIVGELRCAGGVCLCVYVDETERLIGLW